MANLTDSFHYPIYEKGWKRGLAYIFVNREFTKHKKRTGADLDGRNMKKLFKRIGFKLYFHVDTKKEEMRKILKEASERKDLPLRPALAVVISSHGHQYQHEEVHGNVQYYEDSVVTSDSEDMSLTEIVSFFSEEKCEALKDKPKMFFLQVCREQPWNSDSVDLGHKIKDPHKSDDYEKHKKSKPDGGECSTAKNQDDSDVEETALLTSDCSMESLEYLYDTDTTDGESSDNEEEDTHVKRPDNSEIFNNNKLEEAVKKKKTGEKAITEFVEPSAGESKSTNYGRETEADIKLKGDDERLDKEMQGTDMRRDKEMQRTEIILNMPMFANLLIVYSSFPGKLAWRSTAEGGWLLCSLYEKAKETLSMNLGESNPKTLMDILTSVVQNIAIEYETISTNKEWNEAKSTPVIYHTLIKDIVFEEKTKTKFTKFIKKLWEKS